MSKSGAEGDLKSPSDELADYVVQVGEIHRQFQKHDSEHDFSRATEKTPLLGDEDEQKRVMQAQLVDGHLRNNEHLILERDADIRDIEQSIHQVNEIFRDLGTIVHEQQFLVDNIEHNVDELAVNNENANVELIGANRYQKRLRKWKLYCFLILLTVFLVLLLVFYLVF